MFWVKNESVRLDYTDGKAELNKGVTKQVLLSPVKIIGMEFSQ